jgi:hypothetical protein
LENLKGRGHVTDQCRDGRIIKMILKEVGCKGVDWIQLAQDMVQWQALLNMIIKLWVPYRVKISEQLSNYQFLKKDSPPRS